MTLLFRSSRVHCLGQYLPDPWPDQTVISSLVERSSGHFIYASTVIGSPKHRPDDRLRSPREGDRFYAQLDALYTFIFQGVEDHGQLQKICLVFGILYFRGKGIGSFDGLNPADITIDDLLGMKPGDLLLLLDPILSLIAFNGDQVRILHKSMFDYLLDFTRGVHLPFDLAQVHEAVAIYILKERLVGCLCSASISTDLHRFCFSLLVKDMYTFELLKSLLIIAKMRVSMIP